MLAAAAHGCPRCVRRRQCRVRRRKPERPLVEPPGQPRVFAASDWLPLVDDDEYKPDHFRNRLPGEPPQPVQVSLPQWRLQQSESLWTHARLDSCQRYGWPGGLDYVQLMQQMVAERRAGITTIRLTCSSDD